MEAGQAASGDAAACWWTHRSIVEEAEPLDATADDAAASCLSAIAKQTANHVVAHERDLTALIQGVSPVEHGAAATAPRHNSGVSSSSSIRSLYKDMKWDSVLLPLLTQLRRCMARAWEERAAEQADQAADDTPLTSVAGAGRDGAKVTSTAHVDAVQVRRLRALQQQIYLAFFKAVLQGLADGARGATATGADERSIAAGEEGGSVEAPDGATAKMAGTAPAAQALSVLLDSLLTHVLVFATSGAAASPQTEEGEPAKLRRGHHRRALAATGTHPGDWLTGMLPLYLRVAHQQQQRARDGVTEQDGVAPASPPAALTPSPALCLLSYIGAFVQGAGLQLTPSEQETYLPCFTREVQAEFAGQLQGLLQGATAQAEHVVAGAPSTDAAAAAAHIRYAGNVLKVIVDTQLYSEENVTEVGGEDCTSIYAALPHPPASRARPQKAEAPAGVDYSVAPLLTLTSYEVCKQLLGLMSRWWVACQHMARDARACVTAAALRLEGEGDGGREKQPQPQREADGPASGYDTEHLAEVEDAWMGLRRQALNFTLVLSLYAETTLLIVPYTALLADIFFTSAPNGSEASAKKQPALSLEAWKGCIRELHRVTHATQDGSYILFMHTTSGARRQLRLHHRHTRDWTFPSACLSRAMECLNRPSAGAHAPWDATAAGTDRQAQGTRAHSLLPLAFSSLQQPLSVLQEHVLRPLLRVSDVALNVRVGAVVREKCSPGEDGATPGAHTDSIRIDALTEHPLSAAQLVESHFPRHYHVFSALDQAMQCLLGCFQGLAGNSADAEETAGAHAAQMWAPPRSLPATLASFLGAALDEACVAHMRDTGDEVATSELLMFFAAVFRTLPPTALPCLRAALEAFLGEGGCNIIEYLRHHIVDQHRHGLAAFFLPPLRAMALDYATAEDADTSLALTAEYPSSCAMAYAWELPRVYFWRAEDTPVVEAAWQAHSAAQRYLCELVTTAPTPITTSAVPFLAILQEAAAVAHGRCAEPHESVKAAAGMPWARGLAIDVMASVFFGMCRWCALQLSAFSPSPTSEAATTVIQQLCCPRETSATSPSPRSVAHPFLLSLRDRVTAHQGSSPVDDAEAEGAVSSKESAEAKLSLSVACLPAVQQLPRSSHRWLSWFWACAYGAVDSTARAQAAAKRLLRGFSAQWGSHAPTKTLLGIRAMVEQMKKVDTSNGATAVHELREVVRDDLNALLLLQQQREEALKETATAAASTAASKDEATTEATATATATATRAVLKSATLREYLNQVHEALVQRARVSPVDGAVSAATLSHLLHVLSDTHLPIIMSMQERQRMCQRLFFSLANSLPECTLTETLSSVCCLRCILQDIALPYKKSFLTETSAARVYHQCFSDTETDAFRMVQHMYGDAIMAAQKIALRSGTLDEWKLVLLLQHLGDPLSLVRSTVEKLRSTVEKVAARRRGAVVDIILEQLAIVEKSAACTDRNVADDVHSLFTLHPPSPPSSSAAAASSKAAARAAAASHTAVSPTAATPTERRSGGAWRKRGDRRENEWHDEKSRKRNRDDSGGGGGSGGGGENHRKGTRKEESRRHRSSFKRPRH
ncbi:hypothetical protein LSCM1_05389 [Leishmania martiniquensis]|uniref:Uncharacterized protein n=1 Tax=Leishmania martiniquensis TaxID=1580590 RepID=A0A836KIE9_9TRYP|nr:hypothetical protein LSCM1_05389 [Leishmania martiniquensis]